MPWERFFHWVDPIKFSRRCTYFAYLSYLIHFSIEILYISITWYSCQKEKFHCVKYWLSSIHFMRFEKYLDIWKIVLIYCQLNPQSSFFKYSLSPHSCHGVDQEHYKRINSFCCLESTTIRIVNGLLRKDQKWLIEYWFYIMKWMDRSIQSSTSTYIFVEFSVNFSEWADNNFYTILFPSNQTHQIFLLVQWQSVPVAVVKNFRKTIVLSI